MSDLTPLAEALAEIERLQAAKRAALAIADERSKENVALRAALKPFADLAAGRDTLPGDWNISVRLNLLRAARDANQ